MASLREAQKQLTRSRLLETGLGLFEARGYAATTIDDIAAGAGATRATFYLHFASKAELMSLLVRRIDDLFTATDQPPLPSIIEAGDALLLAGWIDRKLSQWSDIRPYLVAVYQAASEPEIAAIVDEWHDGTIEQMTSALDRAGRFEEQTRRMRCVLAFGELESLSRRWMRVGWRVDRETSLDRMAASWRALLLD